MAKWEVLVDCDKYGGDDDVFTVRTYVDAQTEDEANKKAEEACADKYGSENVLGAFHTKEIKPEGVNQ
jgi:hypothetical protein